MLKVISQHDILHCVLWKIWSNLSLFFVKILHNRHGDMKLIDIEGVMYP